MEQEPHVDVVSRNRERCCRTGGEELEGHGRGVVWDAVEIRADGGELSEAEEGLEGSISPELDVQCALSGTG